MRRMVGLGLAAALIAAAAGPAGSQTRSGLEDPDATLVEELVVVAKVRGPAWWRVEDADSTVWILAMPEGRLPPGVTWDRSVLDKRMKGANRLLQGDRVSLSAKLRDVPALLSARKRVRQKAPLEETLPPALRTRFVAARERLGKPAGRYDDWQPLVAGLMLLGDSREGKGWTEPHDIVRAAARKAKVPVWDGPKYPLMPLVAGLKGGLDPQAQLACLDGALDDVEAGTPAWRRAGQAWARGDTPVALQAPRASNACLLAINGGSQMWRNMVRDDAAEIAAELKKPGHSVAIVGLRPLLAEDGVIEQLEARGLRVIGPGEG